MCGRYTHLFTWEELHRLSTLTTPRLEIPRSYNVAPTQMAPVIRVVDGGRRLDLLKWGLIPFWAGDAKIGNTMINARAEGIEAKPAFREAVKSRRAIVPVSGFYEGKKLGDGKQPYYITATDEQPMLLAGLWESWRDKTPMLMGEPEPIESYTIITTTPNELMEKLHDRMPVILSPEDALAWMSEKEPPLGLLKPYPAEQMMARAVSTRVNSPKNNEAGCIEGV